MAPVRDPELPARDKRLIFTITTGRSGTRHLAWALGCFRDVDARHEPKPSFSSAFRTVCAAPETAAEFWRTHKLPSIASTKKPIYAETSHLACKGFLESLIALGYRPDLIHLHRDPREVATSLWRLDSVPGRTSKGVKYNLAPTDPCFLALQGDTQGWHDYQLCYWYCLEIGERAQRYARLFAEDGVRVHRVELAEVIDRVGVQALGRHLELGPRRRLPRFGSEALTVRHRNEKRRKKLDRSLPPAILDELEAEVRARLVSASPEPATHLRLREASH